jgi:hypothetical protein
MRNRHFKLAKALLGLALAALSFLLTGCQSPQEDVATFTNPITARRTDVLGQNLLETKEPSREMIWLNAYRDFLNTYEYRYYLELIYGANEQVGYLDIGPGRSLTIVADGKEMNFTSLGSLEKEKEGSAVFERVRYDATSDDLYRIANAKQVAIRAVGQNGIVVRQFGPENFEKFRKFMDQTSGL